MTARRTALLDNLSRLLGYPESDLQPQVRGCLADLTAISPHGAVELESFAGEIAGMSLAEVQEAYTETFDLDPACALDVGWHLFGDAHERGAFMAGLRRDLQRVGVPETTELPDHLTHVLALVGREHPARAAMLVDLVAPAIQSVDRALAERGSPYVHVLAAVEAVLARIGAECQQEVTRP